MNFLHATPVHQRLASRYRKASSPQQSIVSIDHLGGSYSEGASRAPNVLRFHSGGLESLCPKCCPHAGRLLRTHCPCVVLSFIGQERPTNRPTLPPLGRAWVSRDFASVRAVQTGAVALTQQPLCVRAENYPHHSTSMRTVQDERRVGLRGCNFLAMPMYLDFICSHAATPPYTFTCSKTLCGCPASVIS